MLNFLKNAPKPQYALLDKIRNQLEGVKKQTSTSQKNISKNGLIRQNKKKMLNYSVGNCNLIIYLKTITVNKRWTTRIFIFNVSKREFRW